MSVEVELVLFMGGPENGKLLAIPDNFDRVEITYPVEGTFVYVRHDLYCDPVDRRREDIDTRFSKSVFSPAGADIISLLIDAYKKTC